MVVASYNLSDDDVYLFKTAHHKRFRRDYRIPAWKVALSTTAAPTFFPCFNGIHGQRLIDGGIWANNPIMVGFTEACGVLNIDPKRISILSLGTSDQVSNRPRSLDQGGLWQWKEQIVDVVMRGQGLGALNQAELILGKDKVLRVDPKVPEGLFKLDKISSQEHIAKAAYQSRIFMPEIEKGFMDHEAEDFVPFHKMSNRQSTDLSKEYEQ